MSAQSVTKQSGFVSLFTTIFFMLLLTVITIGFLRLMALEQQQSLNNELSASAGAAAESGVEDGKRAILKYTSLPSGDLLKNELRTAMTNPNCNSLSNSTTIRDALGLSSTGSIIQNDQLLQHYTCLTVSLDSPDYLGRSEAGKSDIFPLRATDVAGYDAVKISWHLISNTTDPKDGDGIPQNYAPSISLPQLANATPATDSWSDLRYPAYLRVQLMGYPSGVPTFTRADMMQRSRTMFLAPGQVGVDASSPPVSMTAADPNPGTFNQNQLAPQMVRCEASPATKIGLYACTAVLSIAPLTSASSNLYLRLTPLYGATRFRVALMRAGSEVQMSEVQPVIDVTGRAHDVYRRIQARVRVNPIVDFPEFAAETTGDICKNMQVSSNAVDYRANVCP